MGNEFRADIESLKKPRELKDQGTKEIRDLQHAKDIVADLRTMQYKVNEEVWKKLQRVVDYLDGQINEETATLLKDPEKTE